MLKSRLRGVGLVELLVAIVICSVGLLALVAVHAASLRYARLTLHRAVAMQLTQDMVERMRANQAQGANTALYQYSTDDFATQSASSPTPPTVACDLITSQCTQVQMRDADLYQWRLQAQSLLPSGAVFLLAGTGNAVGTADLWVAWREVVRNSDELNRQGKECPTGLGVATDDGVRCQFLRVRL